MKYILGILLLGAACRSVTEPVADFIPGVYVRPFQTEFAVGSDTLELSLQSANVYLIHKRSGFNRVKEGKLQAKEWRGEKWTAAWNTEKEVLEEMKRGKLLHFNVADGKLFLGASEYVKVK
jgi:hypothetical protein